MLMLLSSCALRAQTQDRSLVDRLLKPDLTLRNRSFEKRFVAGTDRSAKTLPARAYYVTTDRKLVKNFSTEHFAGTREVSTNAYSVKKAATPPSLSPTQLATVSSADSARDYPVKKTETSPYPGSRPFLVRGKSQKALDRRNPPLTIDQVRELLNKNK